MLGWEKERKLTNRWRETCLIVFFGMVFAVSIAVLFHRNHWFLPTRFRLGWELWLLSLGEENASRGSDVDWEAESIWDSGADWESESKSTWDFDDGQDFDKDSDDGFDETPEKLSSQVHERASDQVSTPQIAYQVFLGSLLGTLIWHGVGYALGLWESWKSPFQGTLCCNESSVTDRDPMSCKIKFLPNYSTSRWPVGKV